MLDVFAELVITGEAAGLNQFIESATARLPDGWSRDRDAEARIDRIPDDVDTFIFARASAQTSGRVRVFLVREPKRFKTTNIVPSGGRSQLTRHDYNRILHEFRDVIAMPVAEAYGLEVTLTAEQQPITHWLSEGAEAALRLFSSHANKGTGSSHPTDFEFWVSFLIRAHADRVKLDAYTLERWLIEEEHWPPDVASKLSGEYSFGRQLLSSYDDRQ